MVAHGVGKIQRTPEDAQRSCTDVCCLFVYLGMIAGLGVCIWQAVAKGDIHRLDSLPDFQGTQCVDKFIFFPENYPAGTEGINLKKHVCVETCPTSAGDSVETYLKPDNGRRLGNLLSAVNAGMEETDDLLMTPTTAPVAPPATPAPEVKTAEAKAPPAPPAATWSPNNPTLAPMDVGDIDVPGLAPVATAAPPPDIPGAELVTLQGYPTVPLAGVLCLPKLGEYQGKIQDLMGSNVFFDVALQIAELVKNQEVLIIAILICVALSFVYLFFVEWFGKALIYLGVGVLAVVPAAIGGYCLYMAVQGEESQYASKVATSLGVTGNQGDMIIGATGIGISCIVLLCACFQCKKCLSAADNVLDAADCLMTMPSLMLEPLVSFVLKIPFFLLGLYGLLVLVTSGDYESIDLTKPETLLHPDAFSVICAAYWAFVWLWTMELLHYISVFVVIYVAEVWYFHHYGKGQRPALCTQCGPTLVLKAWCAAVTKHIGSLIYAAVLMALLRPLRILVNLLLSIEQAAENPMCAIVMRTVKLLTGACMSFMQKVLDLTGQIALMQIAYEGSAGFCEAQKHALELVFGEKVKWALVEGVATTFVLLGVGTISALTCIQTFMMVNTVSRYSDEASPHYVSDGRNVAVAAGLLSVLISFTVLHHFITITDTMAYCKGLVDYERNLEEGPAESKKGSCWNCWSTPPARETQALLTSEK